MADPYPKSRQLARGERRYRRKVASPKQWQAIIAEKGKACRLCGTERNGVEYHHIVPRAAPFFGDDVADNIVPLCSTDHPLVTSRHPFELRLLAERLSDAEYAYIISRLGEDGPRRLFGV